MSYRTYLVIGIVLFLSAALAAANPPKMRPKDHTPVPVTLNGVINKTGVGVLHITTTPLRAREQPRPWIIEVPGTAKILVSGTAGIEFPQAGQARAVQGGA